MHNLIINKSIAWEQRKFTDITFLSGEKNKDNLPYESYSVTNENGFVPQNEQFENGGTMATADKRMYYIVSKNSFAYNPARINVGSIGYYDGPENVIVSSLYEVFKTSEDIDDRYLWHWFKSNNFKKLIEQYQEGGVRLYFYYDKLCMCSLPTPSIQEQIKIGRYFDNLDNLITLHQRKYNKLLNVKKSMLEKMFPKNGSNIPEIRFKGFTDPWEQRKLGDNIVEYKEKTTINNQYPVLTSSRKGIFFQTDYYDGNQIASVDNTGYNIVPYGFFTYRHMSDDEIFHFNINDITENGIVSTLYPVFTTDENLDSRYLQYQLNYGKEFAKYAILQKQGGSRTYMYLNKLKELRLTIPNSVEEQKKISAYFMKLDSLITLHQRELEKLQNIKKSMLEKMFV